MLKRLLNTIRENFSKIVFSKQVFQRIAPSGQLKAFKDSIRLFMHHFILKGGAKNGIAIDKMQLLKERIKVADKSLDTSTIRF